MHKYRHCMLATVVEGELKVPFSKATIPWCRGAVLLSLDCSIYPWFTFYYNKCSGSVKNHF